MKIAIIGSRGLTVNNIGDYLPPDIDELVSGGAKGIDTCAREYADTHNIPITEYLPEYNRYGRAAPIKRNLTIINSVDMVIAFYDGKSRGTKFVIEQCKKHNKPYKVIVMA